MSIALQTILIGGESYRIQQERELQPSFSRVCVIDPDKILEIKKDYFPETCQGRESITNEALSLHSRLEQLINLLANSSHFEKALGKNQVVAIDSLEDAFRTIPENPVSLDIFSVKPFEELPPLLLLGVEYSDVYQLPVVSIEFCPVPEWSPMATIENLDIILREERTGERGRPSFYTSPIMPPGTGRLDCTEWRARQSPVFFLLAYEPSNEPQISKAAVANFDEYLKRVDIKSGEISF